MSDGKADQDFHFAYMTTSYHVGLYLDGYTRPWTVSLKPTDGEIESWSASITSGVCP